MPGWQKSKVHTSLSLQLTGPFTQPEATLQESSVHGLLSSQFAVELMHSATPFGDTQVSVVHAFPSSHEALGN